MAIYNLILIGGPKVPRKDWSCVQSAKRYLAQHHPDFTGEAHIQAKSLRNDCFHTPWIRDAGATKWRRSDYV